jgi:hypothetical protein
MPTATTAPYAAVASAYEPSSGSFPPMAPNAPPQVVYVERRRRRKWPWVVGTLVVLLLACCGIGAAVFAPIGKQWPAHVAVGGTAGGFTKDTGVVASVVADQVAQRMKAQLPVEGAFAAKLDDPHNANRWVLLIGATRLIMDPSSELNAAIKQSTKSMQLTGVHKVAAGALGGEMRCARGRDDHNTAITVCAWIDHGSEAVGLFYGKWSVDAAAAEFRAIRSDVLTRG